MRRRAAPSERPGQTLGPRQRRSGHRDRDAAPKQPMERILDNLCGANELESPGKTATPRGRGKGKLTDDNCRGQRYDLVMPSAPPISVTTAPLLPLSPEVRDYCRKLDLLSYIDIAAAAAARHFRPRDAMTAELEIDPETDEKRIILDVTVEASVDEALKRYDAYLREWIVAAPAEVQLHIGLVYDIRDNG